MAPAKRKAEKSFVHKHNVNPNARESDERRIAMLVNMEIKRYQKRITLSETIYSHCESCDTRYCAHILYHMTGVQIYYYLII